MYCISIIYLKNISLHKIKLLLTGLFFLSSIAGTNAAWSFSITRPIKYPELLEYIKGSEFTKLSFKQFTMLTGENENLWNKLSFNVMKMRVKHDLKKYPELRLSEYNNPKHKMGLGLKILLWAAGIFLLFLLVILIIYSS